MNDFSTYNQVGLAPVHGINSRQPTQHMAMDGEPAGLAALVDPGNPLVWFGVFLLITVGAASVAGSARIGKAKISAQIGS